MCPSSLEETSGAMGRLRVWMVFLGAALVELAQLGEGAPLPSALSGESLRFCLTNLTPMPSSVVRRWIDPKLAILTAT